MSIMITVLDAFEIAEKIERNGAEFYRRAADTSEDASAGRMLLKLAGWEAEHEQCFARMKEQFSESYLGSTGLGFRDTLPDPRAMAGLAVFGLRSDPASDMGGTRSVNEIIRKAVDMEKDSIVFYEGLKDFVPAGEGREKIDDIIREEMRHIGILYGSLKEAR